MAEINYNTMFDQLTDLEKQQYEGVMGMGGFKSNYEKNPNSPLVTQNPNYEKFKAIADTQAQVPEKGILSALNPFSSASASEVTPGSYGLQINNAPSIFDINQVGDPALNPNSVNVFGLDPYGVNEDLIDRGNPTGDSRIVSEEQGLSGGFVPTNRPNMRDIAGDINLNMTDLGNPLGDSRIASEEQGLSGFPGLGQVDQGFQNVLDAREARRNEIAMQQNPDYGQFFDPAPLNKEKRNLFNDLLGIASLAYTGPYRGAVKGAALFNNFRTGKFDKMASAAKSGLGSLGTKIASKTRGINPITGRPNTQRQYEAAREQRRNDRRVEKMLERKAAGKPYSQKNLNKLTTGGSKPGTYTPTGAGTGGKSTKIVCTMMNERYGFGSFRNKIWMKFHEHHGPEYQKGYHAIFLPLVKIAKGKGKINTAVRKVLEHMGRHVTADMFKIMKGKKRDTLGRIYRAIFEPTCHIIGKIKSALGRG